MTVSFVRTTNNNHEEHRRELANAINRLLVGRSNATGTVTLTANDTTTTVNNPNISPDSMITFMPTTANAAAELVTMYVATVSEGSFIITHSNDASTDRTFKYAFIG